MNKTIIQDKASFIAGMEFALRIVRNRRADVASLQKKETLDDPQQQALATAEGAIRIVQVEVGAGRSPLPEFTSDEEDEIARIR